MSEIENLPALNINPKDLFDLFEQGKIDDLCERILETLEYFCQNNINGLTAGQRNYIAILTKIILLIVSRDDFDIPQKYITYFIEQNPTLANLVALTEYKNTDIFLNQVLKQQDNFFKILFLYSPANALELAPEGFFDINAYLASLWLAGCFSSSHFFGNKFEKLKKIAGNETLWKKYALEDSNFPPSSNTYSLFSISPFITDEINKKIRSAINSKARALTGAFENKGGNAKKILVVSQYMQKNHPLYKTVSPLLSSLKNDYELTLFNLLSNKENIDNDLFREVKSLNIEEDGAAALPKIKEIISGDYALALFPDIGFNKYSIILSNMRLAPIQATIYATPYSGWGNAIDYFIGSEDAEPDDAKNQYWENLLLLPGSVISLLSGDFRPIYTKHENKRPIVGCVWENTKINSESIEALRQIHSKAKNKPIFHFIGLNAKNLAVEALRQELTNALGEENFTFKTDLAAHQYIDEIELCDLALDSFPHGSPNSIAENLICGNPSIVLKGKKITSRLSALTLETLDLSELVAADRHDYAAKAVNLIDDDNHRNFLRDKIKSANPKEQIAGLVKPELFKQAIDSIIANPSPKKKPLVN